MVRQSWLLYLVIMHGDTELVVKFERLCPDDPPEPQTVVTVHWLRLRSNVQDVLPLIEGTDILTCRRTDRHKHIHKL